MNPQEINPLSKMINGMIELSSGATDFVSKISPDQIPEDQKAEFEKTQKKLLAAQKKLLGQLDNLNKLKMNK